MRINSNKNRTTFSSQELNTLFGSGTTRTNDVSKDLAPVKILPKDEDCTVEKKKHFKLTEETIDFNGHTLHRIQCIETFNVDNSLIKEEYDNEGLIVKEGDFGGYVESEDNLSDDAWIQENAKVFGNAKVYCNALIAGNAIVGDRAEVRGNAIVYDNAIIEDNADIYGRAIVNGDARVYGNAKVSGASKIRGNANIYEYAKIYGSCIEGHAIVEGNANIDNAYIGGEVQITGNAQVSDTTINECRAHIANDAAICQEYDYMCFVNVGSRKDILTAYRTKHEGVRITVGCFFGDLNEFRKEVAKKDESQAIIKKEYELIADIIQHRFIDHNTNDYLKIKNKIEIEL